MIDLEQEFKDKQFFLLHGDCLEKLKEIPDNSIDSIVTDPPYGLSDHTESDVRDCMEKWIAGQEYTHDKNGFMDKTWDSWVPSPTVWKEVYRVLKPGGYICCFASTRTDDLMSMSLRLAGFRKHPFIGWVFGSGFPKAANLSKALDKHFGLEREVIGVNPGHEDFAGRTKGHIDFKDGTDGFDRPWMHDDAKRELYHMETAPAPDAAKQWDGWYYGLQSLKPAIEPILMFQKPLSKKMVENVLEYGTGAINIDMCRVEFQDDIDKASAKPGGKLTAKIGHLAGKSQDGFVVYGHVVDGERLYWSNETGWGSRAGATVFNDKTIDNPIGTYGREPATDRSEFVTNQGNGRFPANLITDGSPEVVAMFPDSNGAGKSLPNVKITGYGDKNTGTGTSEYFGGKRIPFDSGSGSAARFFKQCKYESGDYDVIKYCTKTSKKERNDGLDDFPKMISKSIGNGMSNVVRRCPEHDTSIPSGGRTYSCGCKFVYSNEDVSHPTANNHPTVKPMELMQYLCTLITPPNGIILDPFNGSGSTGKAAVSLGFEYIGCELDENYIKISNSRIQHELDNKHAVKKSTKKQSTPILKENTESTLDSLFE